MKEKSDSGFKRIILWIIGGGLGLLVFVMGFWQWINAVPEAQFPSVEMPSPNGYDFFLRAGAAYVEDETGVDEITDRFSSADEQVKKTYPIAAKKEWLRRNAQALQLLRQGLQYPELRAPAKFKKEGPTPEYAQLRELARTLVVESRVKAEEGDWHGAADSALNGIEFGYEIPNGGPLMPRLIGVAVQAIGLRQLYQTLPHLDASAARQVAKRVEKMSEAQTPYYETLQEEKWRMQKYFIEKMKKKSWRRDVLRALNYALLSESVPRNSHFKNAQALLISNRTIIKNYDDVMDAYIANARLPYTKAQPIPTPKDLITELFTSIYERPRWNWARVETHTLLTMT